MKEGRNMDVATERRLRTCGQEAPGCALDAGDILPTFRRVRAGVHEQPLVVFEGQRQLGEEFALRAVELKPCPIECVCGNCVHATRAARDSIVMVAESGDRATLDFTHDGVDGKTGVSAVADIIPEKNEAAYAGTSCMRESRLERFTVRVNVAEEPNPHCMTPNRRRPEFGNASLSLTAVNGVDPPQDHAPGGFGPN